MAIFSLCALAAVLTQTQGSVYARLFPIPSGTNGYEEYVQAVDVLKDSHWVAYEQWRSYLASRSKPSPPSQSMASEESEPDRPEGVSLDMTDLQVRRVQDQRYGSALHWLKQGNLKPVVSPYSNITFATIFPEMAGFKLIAKADANHAYLEFADGRSDLAVKDLLEGLKFSQKICTTTRIGCLVSIACQSIILAEFNLHLSQLSESDAMDIDRATKQLIAQPVPMSQLLREEARASVSVLDEVVDHPESFLDDMEGRKDKTKPYNLSPDDKAKLKSLILSGIDNRLNEEIKRYEGPETGWVIRDRSPDPIPGTNDRSVSGLALQFVNFLMGKETKIGFATAVAKARIQLRLLRLHAQVIEYKWQNGFLPKKLSEFARDGAGFDPIVNAPFHYEPKNGAYTLYSEGTPETGRIELKYKRTAPATSDSNDPGPP